MHRIVSKPKSLDKHKKAVIDFAASLKRPLFVIHAIDYSPSLAGFVTSVAKDVPDNNALFICINSKVPYYYQDLRRNFKAIDDYLSAEDYEGMDKFVYDFTRSWYLPSAGSGAKEACGINPGKIVEYDFQLFLLRRIKWFWGLHKIISDSNPDGIIVVEDSGEFPECISLIESLFSIKAMMLHIKEEAKDSFSPKQNLKSLCSDVISAMLDGLMRFTLATRKQPRVLIDPRVYNDLAYVCAMPKIFLPAPFEKGLNLRIKLLKEHGGYFAFYFPGNFARIPSQFQYSGGKAVFKDIDVSRLMVSRVAFYFNYLFPVIAKNIKLLSYFMDKKKIKAIVLRHDVWELQRLSAEVAKKSGVPAIVVQHGVFGEKGEREIFADKIAVWGDMCADIYESFGNAREKCRVTGNPRLDRFFQRQPGLSRDQVHETLGLDKDKKTVLFVSGIYRSFLSTYLSGDENQPIISELISMMKAMPRYQLIIKLHPYEPKDFSEAAIAYYGANNVKLVKEFDLYSLLSAVDLAVTKRSSVGLKAMAVGIPVIIVNFEKRKEITPYVDSGAAVEARTPVELRDKIAAGLESQELRAILKEKGHKFSVAYAYKLDGNSSQRVVDFIKESVC